MSKRAESITPFLFPSWEVKEEEGREEEGREERERHFSLSRWNVTEKESDIKRWKVTPPQEVLLGSNSVTDLTNVTQIKMSSTDKWKETREYKIEEKEHEIYLSIHSMTTAWCEMDSGSKKTTCSTIYTKSRSTRSDMIFNIRYWWSWWSCIWNSKSKQLNL